MWSYQRSVFDDLINEKKTKTTKGWNYKHLGNCLPVVLHCMLAFSRVFQKNWRRYWIETSLTSFHWQLTRFGCSKTLPREGRGWAYHILQLYEFAGSFTCQSVWCCLFTLFTSSIVALKQLYMNVREVVYFHLNVNLKSKIVGCLNPFISRVLVFCSKYEYPWSARQVQTEEPDVVSSANRASASRHLRSAGWQVELVMLWKVSFCIVWTPFTVVVIVSEHLYIIGC